MIGPAVLGKAVGATLFASVARTDHRLALLGQGLLLFFHLHLVEAGAQHTHAPLAIFALRPLVLAAGDRIGRQVGGTPGRVGFVDRFFPRFPRTGSIDARILLLYLRA